MHDPKQLITDYLRGGMVAQLATTQGGRPWACTVYYVVDEKLSIYWLSYPTRRHSEDIAANGAAALTVAVKSDMPVVGIQMEGEAQQVTNLAVISKVIPLYIKKYGAGRQFIAKFKQGINRHALYRLTPKRIVLFDEQNFGQDNAQELLIR